MEQFKIEGLKEVIDALGSLPALTQANIIKNVEAKILRDQVVKPMKSSLPYRGESERKITTVTDRTDKTAVWAGPSSSIYWYRFAELGTKERTTKSGKKFRGIKGANRIPSVVDASVPNIINQFNSEFGELVAKTLERKIKRIKKI